MESLLNIKEAAKFLHVSEMTLRRWTNAGILKCYRIGGRQARRFRHEDLLAFLEGCSQPANAAGVSLGFHGLVVPDGSHVVHLCPDKPESQTTATAFIREGLVQGETVCAVTPEAVKKCVIRSLQQEKINVAELQKSGRLHFNSGMASPLAQALWIMQMARATPGRFRIFGAMTWTQDRGWSGQELRELERSFHHASESLNGKLFFCQYDLERFSGAAIMMALETHSHSVYRGQLRATPLT